MLAAALVFAAADVSCGCRSSLPQNPEYARGGGYECGVYTGEHTVSVNSDDNKVVAFAVVGAFFDHVIRPTGGNTGDYVWGNVGGGAGGLPVGLQMSVQPDDALRIYGTPVALTARDNAYQSLPNVKDGNFGVPRAVTLCIYVDEKPIEMPVVYLRRHGSGEYGIGPGYEEVQLTSNELPPVFAGERYELIVPARNGFKIEYRWNSDKIGDELPSLGQGYVLACRMEADGWYEYQTTRQNMCIPPICLFIYGYADPNSAPRDEPYELHVRVEDGEHPPNGSGEYRFFETVLKLPVIAHPLTLESEAFGDDFPPLTAGKKLSAPIAFRISGGANPYTYPVPYTPEYDVVFKGLPDGLSANQSDHQTWLVDGTPTEQSASADLYSIRVTVEDCANDPQKVEKTALWRVNGVPMKLLTTDLPPVSFNVPYVAKLNVSGGLKPFTWSIDGLPPGLEIVDDGGSGQTSIRGVVTDTTLPVVHVLSVSLADSSTPAYEIDVRLVLVVGDLYSDPGPPIITTSHFPPAVENEPYDTVILAAVAGTEPYRWSDSRGFPPGIALTANSEGEWTVSGEPLPGCAGAYFVQLNVRDAEGKTASVILEFEVKPSRDGNAAKHKTPGMSGLNELVTGAPSAGCSATGLIPPPMWLFVLALVAVAVRYGVASREGA